MNVDIKEHSVLDDISVIPPTSSPSTQQHLTSYTHKDKGESNLPKVSCF